MSDPMAPTSKPNYPNDVPPEQIETLIDGAASLQRQILRRYTQSVLEEMRYHLWVVQEKCKMHESSIATLEHECNEFNDRDIAQRKLIENLAAMCRRLSYAVKRDGRDELANQCVKLLKKYGLGGQILRTQDAGDDKEER